MSEPTVVCDLFQWLPPWGEFALQQSWDDRDFVIDVAYEPRDQVQGDQTLLTKIVRFERATSVVVTGWPWPAPLSPGIPAWGTHDRGQIIDLGSTALLKAETARFQLAWKSASTPMPEGYPGLRHYCLYFEDMKTSYQVVARSVDITDGEPTTSDG